MKIFGLQIQLAKSKPVNIAPKFKDKKKRATGVIVKQIKREVSYEIGDIKLALTLIDNPDYPDRSRLFDIYRYILRDGHLASQIRTAINKVKAEPWLLYNENDTPDLKATKLLNKAWFNLIIEHALKEEFFGFELLELNGLDPATFNVQSVEEIEHRYVSVEKQWILCEGTILGNYLPYEDIKQDIDLIEFVGKRNNLGTLLECAYNVLWKYYARSDWSRANEKVGMPVLVVRADTNDDSELDDVETRAANFGTDGYMVVQKEDEVELLERKSDNFHLTFKDLIALCNEEISKIINGNTATTDTKSFTGSAEVQERTMDDFTEARLQRVVNNINDVLFPYLRAKGFNLNYTFDYPRLKRVRESRINGPVQNTTPAQETETPQPQEENKQQPGSKKPFTKKQPRK